MAKYEHESKKHHDGKKRSHEDGGKHAGGHGATKPPYMEYEHTHEGGSEAVWKGTKFQDTEIVYVGDPEEAPKHHEGED